MARIKPSTPLPQLESWDEIDLALAEIAEHERAVEAVEAAMQQQIDDAKLQAKDASKPHQEAIDRLSKQIKAYAEANRTDLDKRKTKPLSFGAIGWRKSTKIILPSGKDAVKALIRELFRRGWDECITQPDPKINREALKDRPLIEVMDLGVRVSVEDVFWLETTREALPPVE